MGMGMGTYKFLIVFVVSLILFVNPCNGNEVVTKICQQTRDVQFCLNTFESDVRSNAVADAHGMALLSISITNNNIQDTMDRFPDIRQTLKDRISKHRLNVCQYDYRRAFREFRGAYFLVDKNSYWDSMDAVANATNRVIECQNVYRSSDPIGQSPIAADNLKVISLSGLISAIINILLGN
ncbi:hypothetical protein Patl1_00832 [Pistacia atlantica]|uniref:Uncharacterized protein n=1 Tax=Pistacia atlantica TaxID=434234 RepID=A0ACC1CAH6_9ROSI|nr:hypothetical protein Patl1_00832 [Pistacia atlantica]